MLFAQPNRQQMAPRRPAPGNTSPLSSGWIPQSGQDVAIASGLDRVAAGQDMRFGPMSPQSMFRGRTVLDGQGMNRTVHPMMPSTGGPVPAPPQNYGTSMQDRFYGENAFAARHQSPSDSSIAMRMPDGNMRVMGNQSRQGGPGWAFAPASQTVDAYNRMAERFPGLNLSALSFNRDSNSAMDVGGNAIDDQSLAKMMVQARMGARKQNSGQIRDNMRMRLSARDFQRTGNPAKLFNAMNARGMFGQQGGDAGPENADQLFGMAMNAVNQMGEGMDPEQKMNLLAGVASAMLQGKKGAMQIPGLLTGAGKAAMGAARTGMNRRNSINGQVDGNFVRNAMKNGEFTDQSSFDQWARLQGMNQNAANRMKATVFGPTATPVAGSDTPFWPDSIDPATGTATPIGYDAMQSVSPYLSWMSPVGAAVQYFSRPSTPPLVGPPGQSVPQRNAPVQQPQASSSGVPMRRVAQPADARRSMFPFTQQFPSY